MPSTSLRDLAYDPERQTLDVTFIQSGKRYRYFDVTPAEYDALRHAFAKGVHFNRHIKPAHRFTPIEAEGPAPEPISATVAKV